MNKTIIMLAIAGIILSSYLTYLHYVPEELDASFCNISKYLSCATVNTSSYATFLSIPVALLGIIGFLIISFLALEKMKYSGTLLLFMSLIAVLFMSYLTFAELFIIGAVCIICVAVAAITILILIGAAKYLNEAIQFIRDIHIE